jgi:hypothetical protein
MSRRRQLDASNAGPTGGITAKLLMWNSTSS